MTPIYFLEHEGTHKVSVTKKAHLYKKLFVCIRNVKRKEVKGYCNKIVDAEHKYYKCTCTIAKEGMSMGVCNVFFSPDIWLLMISFLSTVMRVYTTYQIK